MANATIEFDARLGRFTVRQMPDGANIRPELDMLEGEQPAQAGNTAKEALKATNDDPWVKDCIKGVLEAVVHSIDPQGQYNDTLRRGGVNASEKPILEYAPALILRKRSTKGLIVTLEKIKKRIESGGDIPPEFQSLAEISIGGHLHSNEGQTEANNEFVFFPKPSNEEQRRIVDKIRNAGGVVVQGPPGTGKSHTIANLICHLLATGQRILITAKTPRALAVLNGLLPDELNPLCINMLGSGIHEKQSLEASVMGILKKNALWDDKRVEKEREILDRTLRTLKEEKAEIERRLCGIRESETHQYTVAEGNYRGTAKEIAEAISYDRGGYEWFTDIPPLNMACPISDKALLNVLKALRFFTPDKRQELRLERPEALPSAEQFSGLVKCEKMAIDEENRLKSGTDEYTVEVESNTTDIEAIRDAISAFHDKLQKLPIVAHPWISNYLSEMIEGNTALWPELSRVTRYAITSLEHRVSAADNNSVVFPEGSNLRGLLEDVCKLTEHIDNGGSLGWWLFRPKIVKERVYVLKTVLVNGRVCSDIHHLSILADALHVRVECDKAWGFWVGRCERIEGPYIMQLQALKVKCQALDEVFELEELFKQCRNALRQCPDMPEPNWVDVTQIKQSISLCRLVLASHKKRLAAEDIYNIELQLLSFTAKRNAHPITKDLIHAVRDRNTEWFAQCSNKIQSLEKDRQDIQKMDDYMAKLRCIVPNMTEELERTCNDACWDSRVAQIKGVFHWAQARIWIEEYLRKDDVPSLSMRIKQIEDEISRIIEKLASLQAWSFCFSRLTENHRQHMIGWQQAMKLLGNGTGKWAQRHRRDAQYHLNECREAIPAWVMPLHRLWDTVEPSPQMFDVIIVDEASQCGLEALPLFYMGKKIIIVGDDKQISPEGIGLYRGDVHRLMDEYLHDFKFKGQFNIENSLFDHGKRLYATRQITLREHFRCMPEIIRFSNDLCYRDTPLIPLRQYGPDRLPPLEHVFVSGGYREGSDSKTVNRPEAEAIVKKIAELCKDLRYKDKTMGVIVLQGQAQAGLIEGQLLKRLGAEEMERRRLVCGNPYSFQGDERDIIFLSMVAAPNQTIGSLTKASDERRFNVAASRARDQMFLFHSVTINDLGNNCLRRRLLEFFENTKPGEISRIKQNDNDLERKAAQGDRGIIKPPAPFGSWFEVDVALELLRKGFEFVAQYEFAGYWIDLVVEGGQARLAVECDGDHWHGLEQYENDMQRQRQLERCGWVFFRVMSSAFYSNKQEALKGLWQMLEERGIGPKQMFAADENNGKIDADNPHKEQDIDETDEDEQPFPDDEDTQESGSRTSRRVDDIQTSEISDAIVNILKVCPNNSCTVDSDKTCIE